jgi:8-oxo-dGTP pyrophosphatase MutT (NUDIX family)
MRPGKLLATPRIDDVKRVKQAGAIPFTTHNGEPRILLVQAKGSPEWIFPKGHVHAGEKARNAAVRELREEGGVDGEIVCYVGSSAFENDGEDLNVRYYLARYDGKPSGGEKRVRKAFTIDKAIAALEHDDTKALLKKARPQIQRHVNS